MELFAKQIQPSQALWFFSKCKFSPLQGEIRFCSNHHGCSKNLSSKSEKHLWRSILSWRLGIYNFTKNEVNQWCSLWILVAPSAGNFPECNFQVGSFDKHLLCHQHYFGMNYPPPIFKSTFPHYALPIH